MANSVPNHPRLELWVASTSTRAFIQTRRKPQSQVTRPRSPPMLQYYILLFSSLVPAPINDMMLSSRSIALRSTLTSTLIHFPLLFLLLSFFLGSASASAKTVDDCTPGFLFCEYYGCQQVRECPPVCEVLIDQNSCTEDYSGTSCIWDRGVCSRDVTCSATLSGCSDGCMYCSTFECIPKASQCPQTCALYSNEDSCSQAPRVGSIGCNWSSSRCTVFDASKGNSTLSPTLGKNSTKPTSDPSSEQDFTGTGMSVKKSWVGIAGIIIGVIFGLLGLAGIFILIWHRRRERRRRLQSDANLHSTHTTLYRPRSFIHALRSVVDNNAKELEAVAPLSSLPPAQRHT